MNSQQNQKNKFRVRTYWEALDQTGASLTASDLRALTGASTKWFGPDPINTLDNADAFVADYWSELLQAFPGLQRQIHIVIGGASQGTVDGKNDYRQWVGGTGVFNAIFENDYLGIPANGRAVEIRWGEFCRFENDEIADVYFLLDYIDLMEQAGVSPLPPPRGRAGMYPAPLDKDGVLWEEQDAGTSAHTLDHIRRFIFDALNSYDQSDLKSMGIADYFRDDVQWYGPGGIGACLSLKEFQDHHQSWWLKAFPDRQVQDLTSLIAEGPYSGGPGWDGVEATHTGPYLDCEATGKSVSFNGMDFWKLEEDQYIENWVFVDMVHLFRQFGIDLFERMREVAARRT
ncbi:MAG: ester cyclase [Pseudomonadota bacterium]